MIFDCWALLVCWSSLVVLRCVFDLVSCVLFVELCVHMLCAVCWVLVDGRSVFVCVLLVVCC